MKDTNPHTASAKYRQHFAAAVAIAAIQLLAPATARSQPLPTLQVDSPPSVREAVIESTSRLFSLMRTHPEHINDVDLALASLLYQMDLALITSKPDSIRRLITPAPRRPGLAAFSIAIPPSNLSAPSILCLRENDKITGTWKIFPDGFVLHAWELKREGPTCNQTIDDSIAAMERSLKSVAELDYFGKPPSNPDRPRVRHALPACSTSGTESIEHFATAPRLRINNTVAEYLDGKSRASAKEWSCLSKLARCLHSRNDILFAGEMYGQAVAEEARLINGLGARLSPEQTTEVRAQLASVTDSKDVTQINRATEALKRAALSDADIQTLLDIRRRELTAKFVLQQGIVGARASACLF